MIHPSLLSGKSQKILYSTIYIYLYIHRSSQFLIYYFKNILHNYIYVKSELLHVNIYRKHYVAVYQIVTMEMITFLRLYPINTRGREGYSRFIRFLLTRPVHFLAWPNNGVFVKPTETTGRCLVV